MPTKRLMCYIQTSLFSAQAAVASMIAEIIVDKLLGLDTRSSYKQGTRRKVLGPLEG